MNDDTINYSSVFFFPKTVRNLDLTWRIKYSSRLEERNAHEKMVERRFSLSQCNYYPAGVRDKEIYLLGMFALIWTDMSSYNLEWRLHC